MCISNSSANPIYDVMIDLATADMQSSGREALEHYRRTYSVVPPAVHAARIDLGSRSTTFAPAVNISFRDTEGRYWFRDNFGMLHERKKDIFAHYGIEMHAFVYDQLEV
jgi:hypothetical protein